jgi:hypothetical protein
MPESRTPNGLRALGPHAAAQRLALVCAESPHLHLPAPWCTPRPRRVVFSSVALCVTLYLHTSSADLVALLPNLVEIPSIRTDELTPVSILCFRCLE